MIMHTVVDTTEKTYTTTVDGCRRKFLDAVGRASVYGGEVVRDDGTVCYSHHRSVVATMTAKEKTLYLQETVQASVDGHLGPGMFADAIDRLHLSADGQVLARYASRLPTFADRQQLCRCAAFAE